MSKARTDRMCSARVQVTTITEMKDNQRLALIKDVAGTNVYEEKKGESEKILNDSLRKMEEIKNVRSKCLDAPLSCFSAGSPALTCASLQNLNMIEARLEKLDKEKEELSQYYALDKERRCGLSPCPHESPCPLSGVQ
jgi:structural maintenance of chromosome 3 (chondroitin sulfate proteoglycan 6)